ncbi:MAG: hypothetical protein LBJ16_02565 [Holosporaceae bacterium]|jgi:hypothetical protein|nr:hypothetical protein [Holosporaceae bacterium]
MKRGIFALSFMMISCFFPTQGMDQKKVQGKAPTMPAAMVITMPEGMSSALNLDSDTQVSFFLGAWNRSISYEENRKMIVENFLQECTAQGTGDCPWGEALTNDEKQAIKVSFNKITETKIGLLLVWTILAKYRAVKNMPKVQLCRSKAGRWGFASNGYKMVLLSGEPSDSVFVNLATGNYEKKKGTVDAALYNEICHWFACITGYTEWYNSRNSYNFADSFAKHGVKRVIRLGANGTTSFADVQLNKGIIQDYCSTDADTLAIHGFRMGNDGQRHYTPFCENSYLWETKKESRISYGYSVDGEGFCQTMNFAERKEEYENNENLVYSFFQGICQA